MITARRLPKKSEVKDAAIVPYIQSRATALDISPALVELNYDNSCNLACPSCRSEVKMAKAEEIDQYAQATERAILPLLRQTRGFVYISGGGEPFASKHYRDLLRRLNPRELPHLRIMLMTNALVIDRKMWGEFAHLNPMFAPLCVSIDAANAETYEKVRRPGKWSRLMEAMDFLAELRATSAIRALRLNFVVQRENYRQIPDFIRLGESWGADSFWFQKMANYGSFSSAEFEAQDICNVRHPEHAEFLAVLGDPLLQEDKIDAHMFQGLLPHLSFPGRQEHIGYIAL